MKLRKYILVLLVSLLFLQSVSAATIYLVTEHEPVSPGDMVFVWMPIKNTGYGTWMSDTVVKLVPANNATEKAVHILDDSVVIGKYRGLE